LVVFPNCKINIGLRIGQKRADGFHNLETVFIPIPLSDILEILPATNKPEKQITYSQSGNNIDGAEADNICIKAYHLLKTDFPQMPAIQMHLHKAIPTGAGLGGGSADGAFTLCLLNELFKLNLSTDQLISYALLLGSDCPFFIINKPCFATGRGEFLTPVSINLTGYTIIIINPGIHINTGWAFSQLNRYRNTLETQVMTNIHDAIQQPIANWKTHLTNDFELPAFKQYPELKTIKEVLYNNGAVYAAMSGSGSTMYGIFATDKMPYFDFPVNYFVKKILL
jgi:4-diphosphocytidyl-2-C-methyl-D-erythritol kinase